MVFNTLTVIYQKAPLSKLNRAFQYVAATNL